MKPVSSSDYLAFPQPIDGIVDKTIVQGRVWRVKFNGSYWFARLYHPNQNVVLKPGQHVKVLAIQGVTLLVCSVEPVIPKAHNEKQLFNENLTSIEQFEDQAKIEETLGVEDTANKTSDIEEVYELPLLDLFTQLQEAGLPLGIDEYRLLLQALQQGFGIANPEALADLCRTLWIKSSDDEHLFNYHFEQLIIESLPLTDSLRRLQEKPKAEIFALRNDESAEQTAEKNKELNQLSITSTLASSELMEIEDEIQVAEAVQISTQQKEEVISNRFTQTDEYFPVTRRQMKQSWRHLRRLVREGLPTELDLEATIDRVVQQGILLEPVLVPRRVNRTELLLLLDQKGSMVPFHALSQRLAETARRGGRLGQAGVYYFHNCPTQFLYYDPTHQQAEPLSDVLDRLKADRSVVLIFSDAGAARGGYSEERLDLTELFLNQLKQSIRYVAWLNPMPQNRWAGTSAEEIAELVPMFEVSRQGMDRAIDVLRGKPTLARGLVG